MSFEHMPGTTVVLMTQEFKPLIDVEVHTYLRSEKAYKVWWTYPQTGERELIKVPEWRLIKKPKDNGAYQKPVL